MEWLWLAMGATGSYTFLFLGRQVHRLFHSTPAHTVHFSPKGGCTDVIVNELKHARREVLVLAYSFTSDPIVGALVEAKKRGARVEIVLDHSNETEAHSDLPVLLKEGLAPLVDPHHAIAHNKVMVIDSHTVITGSFNFTNQAEHENAENLLVLKHHPDLVHAYKQNFAAHKAHARAAEVKAHPAATTDHHGKRSAA